MIISDEYDYLVHLVSAYVLGIQPKEIPDGFSFEKVFEFGRLHEVANIAFCSVKKLNNKPNEQLMSQWKKHYFYSVQRDERQKKARYELLLKLMENNVRVLEVQGSVIKPLYPSSHLRMMSDIDFIIDYSNLDKAEKCLDDLNYKSYHPSPNELNASKDDINIEFHTEFFEKEISDQRHMYYDAMHGPFDLAKPNEKYPLIYRVNPTNLYLYSLLHLLKHYRYSGCGIRRFVDFYYLREKYGAEIDFDYISSVLKSFDFDTDTNELMALVDYWFYEKEYPYDLTKIISRIYSAGNHGNEAQYYQNRIAFERKANKNYSKKNMIIEFLFPKKKDIYEAYPFCQKHNYPLFLCWIHRAIFSVAKIGRGIKRIKKINRVK